MGGDNLLASAYVCLRSEYLLPPGAIPGGFVLGGLLLRNIKAEQYPNREIRVTITRDRAPTKFSYESESDRLFRVENQTALTCHSVKTLQGGEKRYPVGTLKLQGKPGYGGLPRLQKFSTYARRQLLRAGGALETVASYKDCLFLTVTLPGSTDESMEALARYSAFAVQRLKNWIGYRISNNLSLYTWELQKRGALHLHYVVHCPNRVAGEYIRTNLKAEWIRILDAIAAQSGVDVYRKGKGFTWQDSKDVVRVDAQWCEKSVAAYLSKYVSKPNKYIRTTGRVSFCPSRWSGVSRPLLAKLRELTKVIQVSSVGDMDGWAMYENCLSVLHSGAVKCYEYRHEFGDGKTIVSYSENNDLDSIWTHLMNELPTLQDSSVNIKENFLRIAREGVSLMMKSKPWFEIFKQFCLNSPPAQIIKSPIRRDIMARDLTYLLDMLGYTYRYLERTRGVKLGTHRRWYARFLEASALADAIPNCEYAGLIPGKRL